MSLLHLFLTPPIELYPAANVRETFVTTKFWQIFIFSKSLPASAATPLPIPQF